MGKEILALALLIGSSPPDRTHWSEIGRVAVHDQGERFMRDLPLGRPVEKIRFDALGGDIFCRSVQETLASGATHELFHGLLRNNHPLEFDLPAKENNIQMLTFQCGTVVQGLGSIRVFIDPGHDHRPPGA